MDDSRAYDGPSTYAWGDEPVAVPPELVPYWRALSGANYGARALVCPRCRQIFGHRLEGAWDSFKIHISETDISGNGSCFYWPGKISGKPKNGGNL